MNIGPVEVLIVTFPGNQFTGKLAPALADLVQQGTVRIIDLLFVRKDADGNVEALELEQLPESEAESFDQVEGEVGSLLTQQDIEEVAAQLSPNSSAALLVWENVWAARFVEEMRQSGGEVQMNYRVPRELIEEALAQKAAA